jgi:hypothetical protein
VAANRGVFFLAFFHESSEPLIPDKKDETSPLETIRPLEQWTGFWL